MSLKITPLKDAVEDNGLKILVHGQAGAGKTVLCATTGEPTLIISAEAGLLSIKDAPDYIQTVKVKSIKEIQEVFYYLQDEVSDADSDPDGADGDRQFKWICLDSISEIAEVVLAYEKSENKDGRIHYPNMSEKMASLIRNFRDLPHYHVVMTAKQTRMEDQVSGVTSYVPGFPGKTLTYNAPYWFDEVFALRVEQDEDGELLRVLQTARDVQYEAKDRSGKLNKFEKPSLKLIKEKIYG